MTSSEYRAAYDRLSAQEIAIVLSWDPSFVLPAGSKNARRRMFEAAMELARLDEEMSPQRRDRQEVVPVGAERMAARAA